VWFRRTPKTPRTFPGIRLRISTINGVIVEANSEQLYLSAKFAGPEPCTPMCLPGCMKHGWLNLIAGMDPRDMGQFVPPGDFSMVPLKIEIRPEQIPVEVLERDA
jgi:hypothetical protein